MSISAIIDMLIDHGCENLTPRLSLQECSEYPVSAGGFGDVHSGRLDDGTKIAIKAVRLRELDHANAGKHQKRAAKELHAWSKCNHPNVVRLLGLAEFRGRLAMISGWAENGALPSYLTGNPSANRCSLSTAICEGLMYLHENDITHGDLKGANVLVSNDGVPMLMDFGNANVEQCSLYFTDTSTASFSLRWTAPEILDGSSLASRAGDVYALGMTILETFTGEVPFFEANERAIFGLVAVKKIRPSRPQDQIPSQSTYGNILWTLLESCWAQQPELRPSVAHVKDIMKLVTPETLTQIEPVPDRGDDS